MKVKADTFLVKVQQTVNNRIGAFIIDTDYNKYNHAVQIGEVTHLPIAITDQYKYDNEINVGDTIIFHHFVIQPDHKIEAIENTCKCEYFHIYGLIKGEELIPIEDVIFVEPIKETTEDLYKNGLRVKMVEGQKMKQGIVFAPSKQAQIYGVLAGDKVFYGANADYPMKAVGKDLFRMRIRNIFAVERNGEVICTQGQLLIKNKPIEDKKSLKDVQKNKLMGVVVKKGIDTKTVTLFDEVVYYNGLGTDIEINGEPHNFVNIKNIDYILC